MDNSSRVVSGLICLVIAVVLFAFEDKLAIELSLQHQSSSFPSTTGRVDVSEVTITHGSKGSTHYHVHIVYGYGVGGQTFENARFRYGPFSTSHAEADAEVEAHPVGSDITVYYREDNPADSLLSPGVVGSDFLMFFFLIPATVFMLYQLGVICVSDRFRRNLPAGGVRINVRGSRASVRLPHYPPGFWAMSTFCGTGLAACFILLVTTRGYVSTQPEVFAAVAILAATAGVYCWRRARLSSGVDDLVIDEDARTVILPQNFGRRYRVNLDFGAIESVRLEPVRRRRKGGYYFTWAVLLATRNAPDKPEKLVDWPSKEKSMAFAGWLRERLHLPETPDQGADADNALSRSSSVG